jgi:hypothetical protein
MPLYSGTGKGQLFTAHTRLRVEIAAEKIEKRD